MILQPVKPDSKGNTPYQQCMQSGQPVFAFEYKTGRSYISCSHQEFCHKVYKDATTRRHHEIIRPHVRTRVFMDFDQKPNERSEDTFEQKVKAFEAECFAFVNAAMEHIIKHDKSLRELQSETDNRDWMDVCTRLVSHREDKLSLHVIFPFNLETLEKVGKFVESIDHDSSHLDWDVYRKNHSMRLVYSSKYGSDVILTPYDGNRQYNANVVYDSLIQNTSSTGELYSEDFGIVTPDRSDYDSSCMLTTHDDPIVSDLARCITEQFGRVSNPRCTDAFVCFTFHRKCPWIKREHKHNRQIIWFTRKTRTVRAKCMDPECKFGPYLEISNWGVI